MNFCSFFFIDLEFNLTEFFGFEFSFTELLNFLEFLLLSKRSFYLVVVFEDGVKALEFLPGTCAQIFIVEDLKQLIKSSAAPCSCNNIFTKKWKSNIEVFI